MENLYDLLPPEVLAQFYYYININIEKGVLSKAMVSEIRLIKKAVRKKGLRITDLCTDDNKTGEGMLEVMPNLRRFTMLIKALESSELCSVIFIRDYLQFYFEGETCTGTLTTYTFPVSVVNGLYYESHTPGYRDALCSFISKELTSSEIINNQKINLTFDQHNRLEVPINKEQRTGNEAAMLRIDNQITVW